MTFSDFVEICSVVRTALSVLTFMMHIYDRKRKRAVSGTDDSLTLK